MGKSLTKDASGQYRRDLGWKEGRNGGYIQQRFYLGRDPDRARRVCKQLEAIWDSIVARNERTPGLDGERPVWTENTLAIARGVIEDAKAVFVRPPELLGPMNETVRLELLGGWFTRMTRDFPGHPLVMDEPLLKEQIDSLAKIYMEKAARLKPAAKSRETLYEALDAYKVWLSTKKYLTPPESGKEQRTSQTGVKECERADRLRRVVPDVPLSDLGVQRIEEVVTTWANRPEREPGRVYSPTVCKHQVRFWKSFLHWLHKQSEFKWKLPPDMVWGRVKILVHQHEIDARATPQQVDTFTKDELRVLWEYGTDTTRLLMALALNFGFGIAEIGSLKRDQIDGYFARRLRTKTAVYGEWSLWPVTQELVAKVKPNGTPWLLVTSKGKQLIEATKGNFRGGYIPNRWNHLLDRVQEDHPDFRRLSFNKLRKTAGNLIREVAGGEVAGVFLAHGKAVKTDDLADVYTNRPFAKVWEAQDKVWEQLKDIFVGDAVPEARISIGTIRKMQAMYERGVPVKEIAEACDVCESTVRDRLWGRTKKKQSPPASE